MQSIVLDRPYVFSPPDPSTLAPRLLALYLPHYLDRSHGVVKISCHGLDPLKQALRERHGILLAPNHCRPCDPMVMSVLARELGTFFFTMASAHLFTESRLKTLLLRKAGAFSVYREGMDRQALTAAISILESAQRPLVIFPEGIITRANDAIGHLQDGVAFIARAAARKRLQVSDAAKTMIFPVGIRYRFAGDPIAAAGGVLARIEERLSWRVQPDRPLPERIHRLGEALLGLKEKEYIGESRSGTIADRLRFLINHILGPLEREWLGAETPNDPVVTRVKALRVKIVPEMLGREIAESERARRWRQLADVYLVQQLALYPPDYIDENVPAERLLETVERFEEDLTDTATVHRPFEARITVGEGIPIGSERPGKGEADPIMTALESRLRALLNGAVPGEAS